jgi:SAM-dependent methyltransferase
MLDRAHYKEVWNAHSGTEDEAKMAVSGYTDENLYRIAADCTRDMLIDCVGVRSEDTILEIGAGVGRVGRVLAPLCKEWIGADVSSNMLGHLRRRLADLSNVRSVELSGYDLSGVASESVDLVYCTVVFMHLDEWERYRYIREGMRVLKPGGRMLVDNVNLDSDEGWAFFEAHVALPPLSRAPHVSKTSTPQELMTYFRRAGFQEIRQRTENLWIITYGVKAA